MALLGTNTKSPLDLTNSLSNSLRQIDHVKGTENKKVIEDVSKTLQAIKMMLYGSTDQEPLAENVYILFNELIARFGGLETLLEKLSHIDFEGRKDTVAIFINMLQIQEGNGMPMVEYIASNEQILCTLTKGYECQVIALNCGMMLRECCRHFTLADLLIDSDRFYQFFQYVEVSTVDIASDALSTIKELLTRHKLLSAKFIEKDYDRFSSHYQKLLNLENDDTRGQALKLLAEILLNRHNFTMMARYLSKPEHLKMMMNMLRDKSRNVQFEAFHVFKIFVMNPNKPRHILDILLRNKDSLVELLSDFHTDRSEDQQFNEEKMFLLEHIKQL